MLPLSLNDVVVNKAGSAEENKKKYVPAPESIAEMAKIVEIKKKLTERLNELEIEKKQLKLDEENALKRLLERKFEAERTSDGVSLNQDEKTLRILLLETELEAERTSKRCLENELEIRNTKDRLKENKDNENEIIIREARKKFGLD